MRAISLTSAILLTRTCEVLVRGRKIIFREEGWGSVFERPPGGGVQGGRGGAYDCYHLVQHFVRLLNPSKAILRRRRIWAHIIIALEDGLSTEIIEIIINALAN